MKRHSYLAGLTHRAPEHSRLQPAPMLFRPVTEAAGVLETRHESRPAQDRTPESRPHAGVDHRRPLESPAAPSPRPAPAVPARSIETAAPSRAAAPQGARESSASRRNREDVRLTAVAKPRPTMTPPNLAADLSGPAPTPRRESGTRERRAEPTALLPTMVSGRTSAPSAPSGRKKLDEAGNVSVRIGSLEVRISAPPAPTLQKPAAAPRSPPRAQPSRSSSLARGFGSFGVAQG